MSRSVDNLPPTARGIALLLSSTPSIQDAQPGVLHQLLEFSHRYTHQVLTDAKVYAEHAGRQDKLEMDDVILAVQARVGWEFGGRVPQEYIQSLASQTNAIPLPAVPEVFGVRLPQAEHCLTSIDFDLMPHPPPAGVKLYDEEVEEIEESESDDDEEDMVMEPAPLLENGAQPAFSTPLLPPSPPQQEEAPFPISAIQIPEEMDVEPPSQADEGSDAGEEDGLFAGGDDDDDTDGMEEVQTTILDDNHGMKRKLQEDDDYD